MIFSIYRDALLKPLQTVVSVVGKSQNLPVLANVLLEVKNNLLTITGSDLQTTMVANIDLEKEYSAASLTLPGRKLIEIVRTLPEKSELKFKLNKDNAKVTLSSDKTRFTLSSLPSDDFPSLDQQVGILEFKLFNKQLRKLIESVSFSMAEQDVRYYLNGMLFEVNKQKIKVVATDGHRLSLAEFKHDLKIDKTAQIILPRRAVYELTRLLADDEGSCELTISENNLKATVDKVSMYSKLIDGKFPNYNAVLPSARENVVVIDKDDLKAALSRVQVLFSEKYHGVRFMLSENSLRILATNLEQEEANEELAVEYSDAELEIGFNVRYLLDILNTISAPKIRIMLKDDNSSALLDVPGDDPNANQYVLMPMKL